VQLYEKYQGRVQFVIIDLDKQRSPAQQSLIKRFYTGYIPHVVVLDQQGNAVYNQAGEVDSDKIYAVLDRLLK
jgi:thioredoxin-like negative regulator of GroEL